MQISIIRLVIITISVLTTFIHASIFKYAVALSTRAELLSIKEEDKVLGCSNAPNIIIEYSSLSCPHCVEFHNKTFKKIKKDLIDTCKAKYIYRDFPNSHAALLASMLAHCISRTKKKSTESYYTMINILLKSQDSWSINPKYNKVLMNIAKLSGMSAQNFEACISDSELMNFIKSRAHESFKVMGIKYTPTLVVNGERLDIKMNYDSIMSNIK